MPWEKINQETVSTSTERVFLGQKSSEPSDSEIGTGNIAFYGKNDGNLYKKPHGGSESQVGGGGSGGGLANVTYSDDGSGVTLVLARKQLRDASDNPANWEMRTFGGSTALQDAHDWLEPSDGNAPRGDMQIGWDGGSGNSGINQTLTVTQRIPIRGLAGISSRINGGTSTQPTLEIDYDGARTFPGPGDDVLIYGLWVDNDNGIAIDCTGPDNDVETHVEDINVDNAQKNAVRLDGVHCYLMDSEVGQASADDGTSPVVHVTSRGTNSVVGGGTRVLPGPNGGDGIHVQSDGPSTVENVAVNGKGTGTTGYGVKDSSQNGGCRYNSIEVNSCDIGFDFSGDTRFSQEIAGAALIADNCNTGFHLGANGGFGAKRVSLAGIWTNSGININDAADCAIFGYITGGITFDANTERCVVNGRVYGPETLNLGGTNQNLSPTPLPAPTLPVFVDAGGSATTVQGIGAVNEATNTIRLYHTGGETVTLAHNDTTNGADPMLLQNGGSDRTLDANGECIELVYDSQTSKWRETWTNQV